MSEQERFENQLRRSQPARPPENFMARLLATEPSAEARHAPQRVKGARAPAWWGMLRWLAPATAAVAATIVIWRVGVSPTGRVRPDRPLANTPAMRADDVRIDEQLVSSFDAVAQLPNGEPVRFRFQKWMDQVVVSDKRRGVVIEQRTPRLEVLPVGFETY